MNGRLLGALLVMAALPLFAQSDDRYVVRLDPAAAIDRVDAIAMQLAATHGGSIISTASATDDTIVLRIPASRAAALRSDPRVRAVRALKVAADAKVVEPVDWTTGVSYTYDGSGTVTKIGRDEFAYDDVGRLIRAKVNEKTRTYGYDAFGNRLKCLHETSTDCQYMIGIDSDSNRISAAGIDHDSAGNVDEFGPHRYSYDAANMMTRDHSPAGNYEYLYTAEDERLATYDASTGSWEWTLRDHGGNVIRELASTDGGNWSWVRDTVYRDGLLLASRHPADGFVDTHHYHLDHLGTPRRVTDHTDLIVGYHDYYAYGPEVSGSLQEPGAIEQKYTGHEREPGNDQYTLDYMHARFYNPTLGRFLSIDPSPASIQLDQPQTWNRYAYALDSPMTYVDPTGAILEFADKRAANYYSDYMKQLDPSSIDYANAKQLEASDITYRLGVGGMKGGAEGEVTFDGTKVQLHLDSGGPSQDASIFSRLAHEIQHGVQVDTGMLGFRKQGSVWKAAYNDIHDEIQAWNAQLRQASPADFHTKGGNLRGFRDADDKALFLVQRGYSGYAKVMNDVYNAPKVVPGYPPGSVLKTSTAFFRIRP